MHSFRNAYGFQLLKVGTSITKTQSSDMAQWNSREHLGTPWNTWDHLGTSGKQDDVR